MSAIETAIKMEADAIKFYTEAAQKVTTESAKAMLLSIVEDEKKHLEMLKDFFRGQVPTIKISSPISKIKTIFETMKDSMIEKLKASDDDLEAFKVAMLMEQDGKQFYDKAASDAMNDTEKSIFNILAKEEEEHYRIFANTYNFLKDSGNWFIWEQRGIVEG